MTETVRVEVVFAGKQSPVRCLLDLPTGSTVAEAIRASGVADQIENFNGGRVGVFGRIVQGATVLRDGDRVEIYRPLEIDPKDARRRRAGRAHKD